MTTTANLNEYAKLFWKVNHPCKRMELVPGLHTLTYGAEWHELKDDEKRKVRDMLKRSQE